MWEKRGVQPLPLDAFVRRLGGHFAVSVGIVGVSLAAGMAGYEYYEHLPWRDAFLNAAMLLGGMGPVDPPKTDGGKLFAGLYALYAGLLFLVMTAILLSPVFHRMLHHFHVDDEDSEKP
ncbi:MAG: hypothetical protein ACHQ6T_04965 [Myxococcota bacterium]